jgi:hypothetical protein
VDAVIALPRADNVAALDAVIMAVIIAAVARRTYPVTDSAPVNAETGSTTR